MLPQLSFVSTMKGLRTPGGQILKPSKVRLSCVGGADP